VTGFLRSFAASFLALVVLLLVIVGAAAMKFDKKSKIEDHSWLHIDIYGDVLEYDPPGDVLSQVTGGDALTLQKILENLDKAVVDERIDGVLLQLSSSNNLGPAKMQEIRGGIERVQAAGKPVYGYADAMNTRTYYLAAVCDSLYCPGSAYVNFQGIGGESVHVKKAMEKLGIKPELHAIRHYKAAAQMMTRTDLSPEAKQNRSLLLGDIWEIVGKALQEDRGLDEARVVELMEHALFTPAEAVDMGLFDRILYWDELEDMLKLEEEDRLRVVSHQRYAQESPADLDLKGDKKIAVVHAQGNIGGRRNAVNPLLGIMMGHETIVNELLRAEQDEDVAAIVLRVDSGGGDALTSDLIGHAVQQVSRNKPVIVSMVDVAASGGYSVSYRATKIMAGPATVTGSIGSISGKFDLSELNEKIGVTHDAVTKGPNALLGTANRPYTAEEWEMFSANHWRDFRNWMDDVAQHRGIAAADIDSLCMGRIWSGRRALAVKLVDALGGQHEAVALAKSEAGLAVDEPVTLWHLPKAQDFLTAVMGGEETAAAAVRWGLYREIQQETATTWSYLISERMAVVDPLVWR
jgi:protease-4